MPGYQDHLLVGSILAAVFLYTFSPLLAYTPEMVVATTFFVMIASIFPDVDHRNAKIHTYTRSFSTVMAGILAAYLALPDSARMVVAAVATGGGVYILFEVFKPHHRSITHTYRAAVGFSLGVGVFCLAFLNTFAPGVFSLVSYCSHLVLDRTIKR